MYCEDELRYGTRTEAGKRWLPKGERPVCSIKIGYQYGLLYTAICPYNGDLFALFLPHMNLTCFNIFTDALLEHCKKPLTLLLDKATCHTAATKKNDLDTIFFPPACPELNPVERFFKEVRKELKSRVFQSLSEIELNLEAILAKYWQNPKAVISITSFPYFNTQ
ncbi:MAG: transposase [Chitinophagales bacterium]